MTAIRTSEMETSAELVAESELVFGGALLHTDELGCSVEDEAMLDSIVTSALDESFTQQVVGPNCLVLYQFVLSNEFQVGPNGEIFANGI